MPARVIACPFCGLVCDDLIVGEGGVDTRGCAKAAAGFARPSGSGEHRIGGRAVSLEKAVAAAAEILSAARLPLVTGLSADLAGLRALLALADRAGAIVDRWRSSAQLGNVAVMQRTGGLTATFGEIANRADAVLLLGRDPTPEYPRLVERLLRNRTALYRNAPPWVGYLGPAAGAPADTSPGAKILVDAPLLLEALGALAALIRGRRITGGAGGELPLEALRELAQRLGVARYGAIVWDTAAFPAGDAALSVEMLVHILRMLNRETRCVGLPLGGSDNAQGAAQAMLWQTGWPMRVSFAAGTPEHDPWRLDAERLLAAGETDALLWVAVLSLSPPPAATVPTIALVAPDVVLPKASAVEIRIGIPGIDHAGAVTRADGVITLPLAASRASPLPSVAAVSAAILDRLGPAS